MTDAWMEKKEYVSLGEQRKNYPSSLKTTPATPVLRRLHAE